MTYGDVTSRFAIQIVYAWESAHLPCEIGTLCVNHVSYTEISDAEVTYDYSQIRILSDTYLTRRPQVKS